MPPVLALRLALGPARARLLGAAIFVLALVLALLPASADTHVPRDPFFVIAGMVNTPDAVDWAVEQGANAVRIDVVFRGTFPMVWGSDEWDRYVGMDTGSDYLRDVGACPCATSPNSSSCSAYRSPADACRQTRTPLAQMLRKIARTPEIRGVVFSVWNYNTYVPGDHWWLSNKRSLIPSVVLGEFVRDIRRGLLDEGFSGWIDVALDKREAYEKVGGKPYKLRTFLFSDFGRAIGEAPIGLSFPVNTALNASPDPFFEELGSIYSSGRLRRRDFGYGFPVGDPPPRVIDRLLAAGRSGDYQRTFGYADQARDMRAMIESGVDGIVTNEPARLREIVDGMGEGDAR
jgi:hypothetical protein